MKEPGLTELIDVNVLQKLQNGFSKYTGMAALTTDENGVPITVGSGFTDLCMNLTRKSELGCIRCKECDRKGALMTLENGRATVYHCHAGLVDYAAPIMVEGRFVGSFIGGQVRTTPFDTDEIRKVACELGIDENALMAAAKKINILSQEEVEAAAVFLSEIAEVLSEMAYNSYKAINESRRLERIAKSQTSFMINLNTELQKNMHNWMDSAQNAINERNSALMETALIDMIEKGREIILSVDDTVEYSKLSKGELELNETIYNIRDLISFIVENVKESTECNNISFDVKIADNVPEKLMGDTGRIGQIITKVLFFSAGLTPGGSVSVDISCNDKSYATQLNIIVRDNGAGLDDEALDSIKSHIRNGSLRLLETTDGDSTGLEMIGFLLRQMSGSMEVSSFAGTGTEFCINLPQLKVIE